MDKKAIRDAAPSLLGGPGKRVRRRRFARPQAQVGVYPSMELKMSVLLMIPTIPLPSNTGALRMPVL